MKQSARSRMVAGAAAGTLALFLVSGCSSSSGGDEPVKKDKVTRQASADPQPSDSAQPSASAGTDTGASGSVPKAEVARQGKAALAAQVGKQPDAFSCPEDLPAEVGATVRCQLAGDGKQYGVTVTAKSVAGGKVHMDFKVDETPGG